MLPYIVAAAVGAFAYVATRDENFKVERSVRVDADAATIFSVIRDFRQFEHWSPWEKLDPTMQKVFHGETGQPGSSYTWSGNNKVGRGTMTVTEVQPNEGIDMRLEFFAPFPSICSTRWAVTREGDHTFVTWTMKGKHKNIGQKAMGMIMDRVLKGSFDEGLAKLKSYCEKLPKVSSPVRPDAGDAPPADQSPAE